MGVRLPIDPDSRDGALLVAAARIGCRHGALVSARGLVHIGRLQSTQFASPMQKDQGETIRDLRPEPAG